jgi:hypothetical protein
MTNDPKTKKVKPMPIAVGVIAALVLLGGLLWATRRGGEPRAADPPTYEPAASDTPRPDLTPTRQARPAPSAGEPTPAPPTDTGTAPAPTSTPERIVHDHTGEENKAAKSPLSPDTIFSVRKAIQPLVAACAEPMTRAGTEVKTTVVAKVTVAAGKMTISDPVISHPTFKDEAFDACVSKAYAQLALDAPAGQSDTTYKIAQPFQLK